jgi:hypothetical protein
MWKYDTQMGQNSAAKLTKSATKWAEIRPENKLKFGRQMGQN